MEQNFVEFYSPGTIVAEITTKEIKEWDIDTALEMAGSITERYGAKPYGFRFITRSRQDDELDSKITNKSFMHYIGCEVLTLEQIKAKNDPKDKILIGNMERNGWGRMVTTKTGWKWTQPLENYDIVIHNT
jgi:hypothetical protein